MESSRKRKSAPDFDKNEVEREMRLRKLNALEANADFSFLVGTEKEDAQVGSTF